MSLPRGLVFLTTAWIFAAWCLCIGVRPPIQPSIASYVPGVRLFIAAIAVGLCVAWPMLRLSEKPSSAPIRQVLLDFAALAVLLHVVLWPLRLATSWSPERMGLIDLFLFSWAAIIAALLTNTIASRSATERVVAMSAVVAIVLLGPIAYVASVRMEWPAPPNWLDGPVMGVLRETLGGGARPDAITWRGTIGIASAAVASWIAVLLMHLAAPKSPRQPSPNPD
ncbi:MAG: hypothetical protein K8R92_02655 [Planctomycetes bacterium]|nr:hypothetical protein [Planctomycetota bacterium]